MLTSKRIVFTALLTGLQWISYKGANANFSTNSTGSLSSTTTSASMFTGDSETTHPVIPASTRNRHSNATKNPVEGSNTKNNNRTATTSHDGPLSKTIQWPNFTPKDEKYFHTSISTASPPSGWTTTSSDLKTTISVKSSETASMNFTTTTDSVNFTSMVSPSKIPRTDTTTYINNYPANASATSMTNKNTSVTRGSTLQTSLHPKFTDGSSAREHQEENQSHGAVVFGAIIGAVLGSALIGLAGYLMCTKRKSESFGHQRLYDDTRNDPVLRLDNIPEPLDTSLGDLSYSSPETDNKRSAKDSKEATHDTIPMDEMTLSRRTS